MTTRRRKDMPAILSRWHKIVKQINTTLYSGGTAPLGGTLRRFTAGHLCITGQVTRKIVSALKISLTVEEEAQQAQHSTGNAEAHDAFLQGWAHFRLGGRVDLARSIPYLEEAVRLDPSYADAHAMLATVYWDALEKDWAFDLGIPSFEVEDRANRHLEEALKTPNLLAHAQQSRIYLSLGLPGEALREAEKAVAQIGRAHV